MMSQQIRAGRKFLAESQLCVSLNLYVLFYVISHLFRFLLKVLHTFPVLENKSGDCWQGD